MKKRIYRSTVIIVLAALLAFSLILSFGLYFSFSNAYQQQLSTQLNLLSTAIEDAEDPETVFDQWRGNTGDSRLTLIDDAGNVICDTEADADEMENHLDRPEVAEALETGFGISRRQSTTVREMTFYAAQLLSNGNILRISMSQRSIYSVLADTLIFCLLAIPLTMIASSILAGRTTKSILKPIDNLDLDHPADNEIYDEFAPLMSRLAAQNRRIDSQIRELERRQREFSDITENMAEGLIVLNVRGEILTINQSARKIFNLGSEDHIGEYVLTLQRSTELMDVIKRAGSGEAAGEIMHANGRVLQLLGSPVIESGMITGIVLLILDVTERTEAEASRREFTANVSHELKTPLTAIMGYAELMKSGMIPKEDMLEFSDRIYAAAQRLLQLVEDIIHLSRLDEGAPVESEDVDLSEIAEEVCNRLRPNAEAAGLTLTLDASNVTVEAVVHMVDELTANLVDNAIKYNRPNGSITVRVQSEPEGGSITVSDTGIGIAPEHQDRIFERFYRVDKSRSKEIGGTGLGLSIVKHIAAYHHAKISIQSRVGEGTSISVLFPDNLPKDLSE